VSQQFQTRCLGCRPTKTPGWLWFFQPSQAVVAFQVCWRAPGSQFLFYRQWVSILSLAAPLTHNGDGGPHVHEGPAGASIDGVEEVEAMCTAHSTNLMKVLDGEYGWLTGCHPALVFQLQSDMLLWCRGGAVIGYVPCFSTAVAWLIGLSRQGTKGRSRRPGGTGDR